MHTSRKRGIMNKFKTFIILGILLFIYTLISALSYVQAVSTNISESVFRLHVIANSDSNEDQNLKYIVRDAILEYVNSNSNKFSSKEDVISFARNNLQEIKSLAQNVVYENGYKYPVNVEIGNFEFPTKSYGDISLPNGFYDALRVKIGDASGQNWWCVMFPPLCFVDVSSGIVDDSSKQVLEDNLEEEEYALVSEDSGVIQFKFKLLEMFESFNMMLASN